MVGGRGMVELVEVKARAEVKAPEALIQMETQRKKISTAYLQVWIVRVKMGIPSFLMKLQLGVMISWVGHMIME